MVSIKTAAKNFVKKQLRNISDLEAISVEVDIKSKTETRGDGTTYDYKYVEHNGEEYRVPESVLFSLQEMLKKKPNMKTFYVSKSGSGMNTKYTVVPLD